MIEVITGKPYEVDLTIKDKFTHDDFARLHTILSEKGIGENTHHLGNSFTWREAGGLATYKDEAGTSWAKRYAKHVFKKYGDKVPDDVLAIMGDYLKGLAGGVKAVFEFAKYSDWNQGDFAERDGKSCWWGENNDSRLGIVKDPRGYSMLFYKDMDDYKKNSMKKGIGRNWLILEKDYAVTFNGYGVPLAESSKMLSQLWGVDYKKTFVYSVGSYINKGNKNNLNENGNIAGGGEEGIGYIFGDTSVIARVLNSTGRVDIGDIRLKDAECAVCHKGIQIRNSYKLHSDGNMEYVCRDCIDTVPECQYCGNRYRKELGGEVYHPDRHKKMQICPSCVKNRTAVCEVHGRFLLGRSYTVWHTKRNYCYECLNEGEVTICTSCNHVTDRYVMLSPKLRLCVSCYKQIKNKELVLHGKHKD